MKYLVKNKTTGNDHEFRSYKRAHSHLKVLKMLGFKADIYMLFSNCYGKLEQVKVQV